MASYMKVYRKAILQRPSFFVVTYYPPWQVIKKLLYINKYHRNKEVLTILIKYHVFLPFGSPNNKLYLIECWSRSYFLVNHFIWKFTLTIIAFIY